MNLVEIAKLNVRHYRAIYTASMGFSPTVLKFKIPPKKSRTRVSSQHKTEYDIPNLWLEMSVASMYVMIVKIPCHSS